VAGDGTPAAEVRQRYEKLFKERQRAAAAEGEEPPSGGQPEAKPGAAAAAAPGRTAFKGAISSVFTKHLSCAPLITETNQDTLGPIWHAE
jgi:hypothetical protein